MQSTSAAQLQARLLILVMGVVYTDQQVALSAPARYRVPGLLYNGVHAVTAFSGS